jgi:predicted nucleotidyltransferase
VLETLISSKTRVKLLLKLFLNSNNRAYLRGLEVEFGENSNAIRSELNRLEEAGMIWGEQSGNKKIFKANTRHPLFKDIHNILLKHIEVDTIVNRIISQLGDVKEVYLAGSLARGNDSGILDIEIVGQPNQPYLAELIRRAEGMVKRKIRYLVYSAAEFKKLDNKEQRVLIWNCE